MKADWMEILPTMIRLLQEEIQEGTLEDSVKASFRSLMDTLLDALKPGCVCGQPLSVPAGSDWGSPRELVENIIPMVRNG